MTRVGNFTDQETLNLTDDFCHQLNLLRNVFFNDPIFVVVGWRSKEDNAACGGQPDSPHLMGKDRDFTNAKYQPPVPLTEADQEAWNGAEAMDILRPTDPEMYGRLMWAIGKADFTNVESCPKHIHISNSKYVPQNAWYQGTDH